MTHIFELPTDSYNKIAKGDQTFDIINFRRKVSVGDVIIYQRLNDTENESEDPNFKDGINDTPFTEDEYKAEIIFIFEDVEKSLKKGFVAIGIKEKE